MADWYYALFLGENSGINASFTPNPWYNNNTGVGINSLESLISGRSNTALGYNTQKKNTVGDGNTAVGTEALRENVDGNGNTAMGYRALMNNTGDSNVAFGHETLFTNTSGIENAAGGYQSMYNNSTGSQNSAFGFKSLFSNTVGSKNAAFGAHSLESNTEGSKNSAYGYGSLTLLSGASFENVAFGYNAGSSLTLGTGNVLLGARAGENLTSGNNNIIIGVANQVVNPAGSNQLDIADVIYGDILNKQVAIGAPNFVAALTLNGILAFRTLPVNPDIREHGGYGKLYVKDDDNLYYRDDQGNETNLLTGPTTMIDNLSDAISKNHSLFIGEGAGVATVTGSQLTKNTGVGIEAMNKNTSGEFNTASGYQALYSNTTGNNNTAIGYQAAYSNQVSSNNVAYGYQALYNSTGANNTAFGSGALYGNTTGSNNIAVGFQAGDNITTGSNNIVIGNNTDVSNPTGNNQLNIGNSIYGDLSSGNIGIGVVAPSAKLDVDGGVKADSVVSKSLSHNLVSNNLSGLNVSIDWSKGNIQEAQVAAGANPTTTYSFSANPAGSANLILFVRANAQGKIGTINWPSLVRWNGGSPPDFNAIAINGTAVLQCLYDTVEYRCGLVWN